MKKIILSTIVLASVAFGSASIISGTSQAMNFNSYPEGATVKIDGKTICKTPCTQVVDKHSGTTLIFEKDGYQSRQMIMSEKVNILTLLGGLFGTTTDSSTGALWEYTPNNYYIELREK
jgi:hypothetical protein